MAEGRIDEIISEGAFRQLDTLIARLGESQAKFTDNVKGAIALNNAIAGSKSFKDFTTSTEKAQLAIDKLAVSQAKVAQAELRLEQQRSKAAAALDQQQKRQEAADIKQKARIVETERAYTKLSRELEVARKNAQDLAVTFGVNSKEFANASKNVIKLDNDLKVIDGKLGKFQRNVGNYASGFNGLGNSINQITREFPAFAFSVQTGFLALSNNIPIFFDEISRTRKEIALMRAEGEKVPSLLSQIGKSFFSLSTILSIIVSLSVIYGKEIGEFFTALFKGKGAMDAFVVRQEAIKAALNDTGYKDAIKNVAELTVHFKMAEKGLLDKDKVLKEYNETMGVTVGEAKTFNEAETAFIKNTGRYIQVMALRARANAALSTAVDKTIEMQKMQEDTSVGVVDRLLSALTQAGTGGLATAGQGGVPGTSAEKVSQERRNARIAALRKEIELYKQEFDRLSNELKGDALDPLKPLDDKGKNLQLLALKLEQSILEGKLAANKALLNDESKTVNERFRILRDYTSLVKQLNENAAQQSLTEEKLTATEKKTIIQDRINADQEADRENAKTKLDIQENYRKQVEESMRKMDEALKIIQGAITDNFKRESEQRQLIIERNKSNALDSLDLQYAEGLISTRDYNRERFYIENDAAQTMIQIQIDAVRKIIALGGDVGDSEKKLAELQIQLSKQVNAAKIKDAQDAHDQIRAIQEAQLKLSQDVAQIAINLIDGQFIKQKNAIQEQLDLVDIQKKKELDLLTTQVMSTQQRADQTTIIEAQAQSKKELLAQRQRKVDLAKARFDRQVSVARVIALTAEAVARDLFGNKFLIPYDIAIGAAQVAAILASPLPRFEKGGKVRKDGAIITGEAGTELRVDPSGQVSLTDDRPNITYAKAGTQIVSHKELVQMVARPDAKHYVGGQEIDIAAIVNATHQSSKRIESAILSTKTRRGGVNYYSSAAGRHYLGRNL